MGVHENYEANKEFLTLWLVQELSTKEIAEKLGRTRAWVKGTKQRLKYRDHEKIYGIERS